MAMMKAVRMHAFGNVDVLHYEEMKRPLPQAGEVLVRVRAAGVNPVDWGARSYPMPSTTGAAGVGLPYILGWDLSGDVVALGVGVALGEAVYGMPRFPGEAKAYSEYTVAPASDLARKPEQLTYQEAAAAPMAALIAWQALFDTAQLRAGQTVLIPGGAGSVGHLAIQLAKWKGARVITTTSTRNVAFVRELGADVVIDYTRASVEDVVQEIDVVLDITGEDVLRQAFRRVKRSGRCCALTGSLASNSQRRQARISRPSWSTLRRAAGLDRPIVRRRSAQRAYRSGVPATGRGPGPQAERKQTCAWKTGVDRCLSQFGLPVLWASSSAGEERPCLN